MTYRARNRFSLLAALIGLPLLWCLADTLTGEVRGRILDVQGHVPLSGVTVTLINRDRGWKRQLQSDASGDYLFIQLEPGNYSLVVEKQDYYRTEKTDVLVPLNQPKVVIPPIELRKLVSTPTQQITLRGEQTKTAVIDLTAPGPSPTVLAYLSEPGRTSLVSLLDWTMRSNYPDFLLQNLPLRGGRSFDQVSLLSPGVFRVLSSSGEGPAVGIGVGSAGQFSVNGLRGRSNNFTVDGSDNNDEDIGMRRQGFVSLVPQGIDSIQELQVMTAGFPAEFGRNHGSMVNAVSRAGGQSLHGSLFGSINSDILNAGNSFDTRFYDTINTGSNNGGKFSGKDFSWHQYGGVIGGPIVPGKLFYFLSAERQQFGGAALRHFVVPASNERGLSLRDGFVPIEDLGDYFSSRNIPYSDLAGKGVLSLYPLPNNPAGPFSGHNYTQLKRKEGLGTIASSRLDGYLSPSHSLFGRYNLSEDRATLPFTGDAFNSSLATRTRTQNISMFLNSTLSRYGNALRFSYGRTRLSFPPEKGSPLLFGSPLQDPAQYPFARPIETAYGRFGPFGATGAIGQLAIAPYSAIGIDVFNFPQGRVDNTFQVSDIFTRTGRRHTLKAGFDIRRSQLNSYAERNSRPLVQFGYGRVSSGCTANPDCSFATGDGLLRGTDLAALGAPAGFLQAINTVPGGDTSIGLRFTAYDFFAQGDWKVRSNLTLNIGLRYELQTVPVEVNRRIEQTFNLSAGQFGHMKPAGTPRDQDIIIKGNAAFDLALSEWGNFLDGRTRINDPDKNRFGPRFGLAWDPFGQGTTSVRAGYSFSFDAGLGAVTSQSRNVFPSLVPLNLDLNFRPPAGLFLNNPAFFTFVPTQTPLIRPGTLNAYNLAGDAFATGLGTLFVQAPPIPGANLSSNGLAFTLPERVMMPASAHHFLLSVEKQLGADYLISASYVGTVARHLLRFTTPNAGLIATPVLFSSFNNPLTVLDIPPSLSPGSAGRPKSGLGAYNAIENSASSDFHSLQTSFEKRLGRGIQGRVHWTWSHGIDQVSDPFDGRGFFALAQDELRQDLERASASFDVRHRIASVAVWDIPAALNRAAFRGWRLSAVWEFQTGQPFTVNTAIDRNLDGNLTDRLDSLKGLSVHPGDSYLIRLDPGTSPLGLLAGSQGQNGRVSRNSFRADGFSIADVALSRQISLPWEKSLQLRIECLNLFNKVAFGVPVRILESPGFGRSYDTQTEPRSFRIFLKVTF